MKIHFTDYIRLNICEELQHNIMILNSIQQVPDIIKSPSLANVHDKSNKETYILFN